MESYEDPMLCGSLICKKDPAPEAAAYAAPAAPVYAAPAAPAYVTPGYTPITVSPDKPAKKSNGLLITVVCILLAVAATVGILFATGVFGKSDEDKIRDRISTLETCINRGDYNGAAGCFENGAGILSPYALGSVSIHVDSIVITGDRADVRFTMIYVNGGSYECGTFVLMKHGNDWLIHSLLDY